MKGGYRIIDLGFKTISSEDTVIPGIYEAIEGAEKPIMLQHISVNTGAAAQELKPCFVQPAVDGTDYVITMPALAGYHLVINDDDEVTVEADEANE